MRTKPPSVDEHFDGAAPPNGVRDNFAQWEREQRESLMQETANKNALAAAGFHSQWNDSIPLHQDIVNRACDGPEHVKRQIDKQMNDLATREDMNIVIAWFMQKYGGTTT